MIIMFSNKIILYYNNDRMILAIYAIVTFCNPNYILFIGIFDYISMISKISNIHLFYCKIQMISFFIICIYLGIFYYK